VSELAVIKQHHRKEREDMKCCRYVAGHTLQEHKTNKEIKHKKFHVM